MPSTYIFQLTDRIYQKRLLSNTSGQNNSAKLNEEHDKAISETIKAYETTYLQLWKKINGSLLNRR
jgi:hypothetical protein